MTHFKNKALIVASETPINFHHYLEHNYFIVGVERGALRLMKQKIPIDLAIGDFDKVTKSELRAIKDYAVETIVVPQEKDYLDGELAILAIKKIGIDNIKFVAEPNLRYDKNISVCALVWRYNIIFFNENTTIFRVNRGKTILPYELHKNKRYVSFLAIRPTTVTISNFKYNAKNLRLLPFDNRAISNEFLPKINGEISSDKNLLAILSA